MNITIGERIAYFRRERKLTVNGLAMRSGVSQSYVRELEKGSYENPSLDVIEAICGALGVSLSEFFDEEKDLLDMNSELLEEIKYLCPEQREQLREFLKVLRTKSYINTDDTVNSSSIKRKI